MALTFNDMMTRLLAHEGGYTNNPKDPGGPTNYGITQAVYDKYREEEGLPKQSVKLISLGEASEIYLDLYYSPFLGLPAPIAFQAFDGAVNSGVGRSIRWLQQAVGVKVDGLLGVKTEAAVWAADPAQTIDNYLNLRLAFMKQAKDKNGNLLWPTFGRGWQARIDKQRAYAKEDLA